MGTASDRYAGWIGQIYPELYRGQITSRTKKIGGQSYREDRVPVDSVSSYFEHLDILELDFTYYTSLRDAEGRPDRSWHVMARYADSAPDHARFLAKAPRQFSEPRIRLQRGSKRNPSYLDSAAYVRQFLDPARELLGDRLVGVVFEQGYQRKNSAPTPGGFVAAMDAFVRPFSFELPHHLEVRTPSLLGSELASWAHQLGVGIVLSHWTWLPPLAEQWRRAGKVATAFNRTIVTRLLTPLKTRYAESYAAAYPFSDTIPDVAHTQGARDMVRDVVQLIRDAAEASAILAIIANNRAWGNAPNLLQAIAEEAGDVLPSLESPARSTAAPPGPTPEDPH